MTRLEQFADGCRYRFVRAARSWSTSPLRAWLHDRLGIQGNHPSVRANETPGKRCIVMAATGTELTYRDLDDASLRAARLFRDLGLRVGDGIALLSENHPRFFEICWAAQRSGLYYTPINPRLTAHEASYILDDCGAKLFITTARQTEVAAQVATRSPSLEHRLMLDGCIAGYASFEPLAQARPATPLDDETEGKSMLYSSGTLGRPKGVTEPLTGAAITSMPPVVDAFARLFRIDERCVLLSPGPLHHAAPLAFCMTVQTRGGTCIVMEKFDAERLLELIAKYRVTHVNLVPTMFVRLLKLPLATRRRHDLSSLRVVIHGAAPCPVSVKEQMIDWWGPILYEYYSATEGNIFCLIDSRTWLRRKGSVGKPVLGPVHILDDAGAECRRGDVGEVWSAAPSKVHYHNDPIKSARARNERGWTTLGDMGYLDDDGYLYLTDRKAFTIITGGAKVYPREVEDVLIGHEEVVDAAVFGIPDDDLGERVMAVVQPTSVERSGPALEAGLIRHCRDRLADFKCPRTIAFVPELPRHDNGKLYKRELQARYAASYRAVG